MYNLPNMTFNQTRKNMIMLDTFVMIFIFFFIYTGVYKLINMEAFRFNLARTGVYPDSWLFFLPYFIATIELIVVVFLMFRKKTGVFHFGFVMTAFTIYILYLFYTGRYEVCGCGGVLNGLKFEYHLAVNLVLVILSIIAVINLKLIKK